MSENEVSLSRCLSWVMVGHGVLAPAWHQKSEEDRRNPMGMRPAAYDFRCPNTVPHITLKAAQGPSFG